tara:strand:+ start:153334 stop:154188 length:855 start_codon:yes stop_codon:yes gene_type:complete
MYRIGILSIFLLFFVSCDYFKQGTQEIPVARVNNSFLYKKDLSDLISGSTSEEDSILIVNNYIKRWATQQLLIDQAKINLSQSQLDTYERLVNEYKNDLYSEAYKNAIVNKQLDSSISAEEYTSYYERYNETFRLKEELLKVRYIQVDENYSNLARSRELLQRFNAEDKEELNELSLKFRSYNFNDSTWVKKAALINVLPALSVHSNQVLKKSNFAQLQDSLGVYLVKIEDMLQPGDIAPLSYIKPTIEQIILNKRKLELIKKLEKDITKDAIENKNFETYSNQ